MSLPSAFRLVFTLTCTAFLALPAFALPTVSLTAPAAGATFGNPAQVTISATATPTSGSSITKVEFYRGGTTLIATVNAPGPYTTVWNATTNGSYSLTAKAYDSTGNRTSTARSITIAANTLPTVSITAPANNASFAAPANITINATAADTDGTISKVEFFNGATLLGQSLASPFTIAWNGVAAGSYSLTAKATDNSGGVKTSTAVNVTVANPTPPTVSLTAPANGATFAAIASITVTATASASAGATISKVDFFAGSTLIGTKTGASPYSIVWSGVTGGTYVLTAVATDSRNLITTSAARTITVSAPPPPTVSLTAPANGATFTPPATISLAATATPGSGASILKVEFFNGATLLNNDQTPPFAFSWTSVPAGTYTLTAKATDNKGSSTTSAPVTVTVAVPTPPPTVFLTLPAANVSASAPASVQLQATAAASAPATLSRVEFYAGGTLLAAPATPPYTFNWTNIPSGGYTITAKAIDSLNKSTVSAPRYVAVDGADSCNSTPPLTAAEQATKLAALERLPLTFEENRGQTQRDVRFQARGAGFQLFLTPTHKVVALPGAAEGSAEGLAIRLRMLGANPKPAMTGVELLAQRSHYLAGRDPGAWRTNVPHFAKVRYEGLYPGIDEVFHGTQGVLENDFIVAPGADPRAIRFALEGADRIAIDKAGDLVLKTRRGDLVQKKPVAWQDIDGVRRTVQARYRMLGVNQVGFALGAYDKRHALVIDPVLVYSTYLGAASNGSAANAIALSRCGEAFIAGSTFATDFPTTPGAIRRTAPSGSPMMGFVSKLNQAGTALLYSTYLTGTVIDFGDGFPQPQNTEATTIAVDATGHAYVGGNTTATDFPTTPGSWNATSLAVGATLGFLAKLNTDGTGVTYGTYLGAPVEGVAVDASGSAYAVGGRDLVKLAADGSAPAYQFLLGGSGFTQQDSAQAVAVDAGGNAYVTGNTYSLDLPVTAGAFQTTLPSPNNSNRASAFVAKVNPGGTGLVYGTYLGNVGQAGASGIAIDAAGNAYVSGWISDSTSVPNFAGAITSFGNTNSNTGNVHAFVAKLNATGTGLTYLTRLGGSFCSGQTCFAAQTRANGIAVDSTGAAWVTGVTGATQIPMVKALQDTPSGLAADIFAAKLSPAGNALEYSTYLHGTATAAGPPAGNGTPIANGIAVDSIGSVYVTGTTDQSGFPTTPGALQTTIPIGASGFVTKINESKDTTVSLAVSPNPSAVGTTTTLTATVTGNSPTGTVTFKDGAATMGTGTVTSGSAQLATTTLTGGAHSLTASYGGDTQNNPGVSSVVVLNVSDPVTPPTATLTGIADGAVFTAAATGTYTGASVSLNAAAAPGNTLTEIRIYLDGTYLFWNVSGSPSVIQPRTFPALSPGVHVTFATATDNQGHTTTTPAVRFIVNPNAATPPTAVTLTAPTEGAAFISPESIAMAATATPAASRSIASITYYGNGILQALGGTSPFAATWTNSQPGSYSVRAVATDNQGGMAFSPPVTVTVGPPQPPTVAITTPASGATYTAPATVAITANATGAAGATISQVEFLQGTTVVGTATASPFTVSWNNVAAGSYSLTARATDSRTSKATSSPVTITVGAAPSLSIAAAPGLNGSTVNESTMLVSGSIVAPPNSGVTVNGILATVGTDNQFSVNEVPLVAGANTINLVVTTQDGATASQAITVTSSGAAAPFSVTVDEPDGIAPHTVTFSVTGGATPVATIEFDVDGNGTVDITMPGIPVAGVQATYSSAGTASPRITFKDAAGAVIYTTTKRVHIIDPADKYDLVKGAFSDVMNRLKAGTNNLALNLFFGHAKPVYEDIFNKLGTDLPTIANQFGTVEGITFSRSAAQLTLSRTVEGSKQVFTIQLMRGEDGIWRIESM